GGTEHGGADYRRFQVSQRIRGSGAAVGDGGGTGRARGGKRDQGHERDSRTDPGNVETNQASRRIVAGDRRDYRTDFRHYRTDQRTGIERGDPGSVGRRSRSRLLGGYGR